MKLLVLISLFSINVGAQDTWRDVQDVKNSPGYTSKILCEKAVGNSCGVCVDNRRCKKGMDGLLIPDTDGIIAADVEDAQKLTDLATRSTKSGERDGTLKQCVRVGLNGVSDLDPDTATTNQLANRQNKMIQCFIGLMKEVMSTRLDPADL